jgi:hypothetical protein
MQQDGLQPLPDIVQSLPDGLELIMAHFKILGLRTATAHGAVRVCCIHERGQFVLFHAIRHQYMAVPLFSLTKKDLSTTATGYAWFVWEKNLSGTSRLMWIPPCRKQLERPGDYDLPGFGIDLEQAQVWQC